MFIQRTGYDATFHGFDTTIVAESLFFALIDGEKVQALQLREMRVKQLNYDTETGSG